jgi:hypothetical protein
MNAENNTLEGSDREPLPDGNWIEAWKSAEREPVFFSKDPWEWRFLEAMWVQEPVTFRYWGGSSPGAQRCVIPRRVFRIAGFRALYFSGWCNRRREERTFRMDRATRAANEQ